MEAFTQYGLKEPQNTMEDKSIKKVPHVRAISLEMQAIAALVQGRLGWDEERYNHFQMEAGYEFLKVLLSPLKGDQSTDEKLLSHSRLFWGWWRNEWHKRDLSIYKWRVLSVTDYEYLHTNDVISCEETKLRFWGHVPDFIKAGERAIKREVAA